MLSSKANAALTRVKEIEEKYKMKRREQRWKRKEVSTVKDKTQNIFDQCINNNNSLVIYYCQCQISTVTILNGSTQEFEKFIIKK